MEENKSANSVGHAEHAAPQEGPPPFVGFAHLLKSKPPTERWMKTSVIVLIVLFCAAVLMIVIAALLESGRDSSKQDLAPRRELAPAASSSARMPSPQVVNAFLDVPVTNYIVRRTDVVVEYPVTNYVIRPYVVVVDFPVTNTVVQLYEVVVECPVTNTIVHTYGVTVEAPVVYETGRPEGRGAVARVEAPIATATVERTEEPVQVIQQFAVQQPPPPPPVPVIRRPLRSSTPYCVAYGDTVGKLARRYGFRISDFLVCNPGIDMEHILVGQILQLPGDLDL